MSVRALWRRLDGPGHDAASLERRADLWALNGSAVFLHASGPAALTYCVETDAHFTARSATIRGFVGDRVADHDIRREDGGWRFDGVLIDGLSHLPDLDLSFTPATNALALKRASPPSGERVSLPAAWFDLETRTLAELPQTYERTGDTRFRYAAPSVGYEAILEFRPDGFVALYPGLWAREDS